MSLLRSFDRVVAKATYDPELEKQLAKEKAQAREARAKFRESINALQAKDREYVVNGTLTQMGATQTTALFKTVNDWLSANPNATTDEITDKMNETVDKLSNIYNEDKNRAYFLNSLTKMDTDLTSIKARNIISEDTYSKCKQIVDTEKKWFEKNPNEDLLVYKERLQKMIIEIQPILNDPETMKKLEDAQKDVKISDNTKELQEKQREAEVAAKEKEQLEKQEFSFGRLLGKVGTGVFIGFTVALFLALGLIGGSLASNEAIVRPLPFRALYFFYGFIFSPLVIIYFIFRYFQGRAPYFGALLFPLYEYDPTQTQKESFFERLFYFKSNPIIHHANKTFQDAAEATKDIKMDFLKVASEIATQK